MAKLVCRAGPDAGHEYPLDKDKVIFGRRSGCDVQIIDSMASREHFVIRREGRLYTVSDLESRNGTKVNGRKIVERQLEFGDVLSVGEVEWLLVKEEGDVELRDLLTSKYEIIEKIGEGGMGIVYKAIQRSMDRTVALKILSPKYAARPKFVNQFIEEARAAGRLNHPNIIQVHDVDTENGIHYFSMEFIDGATCLQLLRNRGPFPVAEALEIIRLTGKALAYAHEQRIIHRDVKPDNVMIGLGNTVKLADLGISKTFAEAEAEDTVKRIVGTPHYMAPEAAQGRRIDHRVDIYSLGATLYQMLTGKTLFPTQSAADLLKCHIKKNPKPARDINPAIPESVERLLDRMLAKEPEQRMASAAAVMEGIEALQREHDLSPDLPSSGETQMLRRFASGRSEADQPSPTRAPTRQGTTRADPAQRPRSRPQATGRTSHGGSAPPGGGGLGTLKFLLALVLLGLLGLLVYRLRDTFLQKRPSEAGTVDTAVNHGGDPDPLRPPPPVASPDPMVELRRRLDGLEAQLNTGADRDDLARIRTQLDEVAIEGGKAIATRVDRLRARIDAHLGNLSVAQEAEQLRLLQREIDDFLGEDDFDAAIDRLKGFRQAKSSDTQREVTGIIERLSARKADHVALLQANLERLQARKDAAGLRALKADLPASLLDDPIAEAVQTAINAVDDAVFEQHQAIVDEALADLSRWQLQRVIAAEQEYASRIAAKTLRDRLTAIADTARQLAGIPSHLQQALDASTSKPKVRGSIRNMAKPLIIGATGEGLQLAVSTGTAVAIWPQLSREEFDMVFELVCQGMPEGLAPALDTYFALRAGDR